MFRNLRWFCLTLLCVCLSWLLAPPAAAAPFYVANPAAPFADASVVNLLERWNSNGTYAVTHNDVEGHQYATVDYAAAGNGWRVDKPGAGTKTVTLRYTFDSPKLIDRVTSSWREANHSTDNYVFRDQSGDFVVDPVGGSRFAAGTITNTFAPRVSNYVEFETVLDTDPSYFLMENLGLGAYLAPGETLPKDGSYNIMYDEVNVFSRIGGEAIWTDFVKASNGAKPSGTNGAVVYALSKPYEIHGAHLSQYDTGGGGRFLANAQLDVSMDGVNWTTVYSDADWRFRGEPSPRDLGYMVLDAPYNTLFPQGQYVRLSWSGNTNPVEITEFQLFGVELMELPPIPEPGTATLLGLALVGGGWRRRRRERSETRAVLSHVAT